ncbi:MAG: molybdopterin-binding protein [Proteobacteria bacterium]|nr:MAG: molybdopterin-binding protein [Pseudomonadota bacterium]PIE67915.1 MAG: molybdopterin-binding protein [Deltaproteobacteria bacterium]
MYKSTPVEESVGMVISHDISEIVTGSKKGAAFKKGHIIREEDIVHLKRLGKDNIYSITLTDADIHENEAASILAKSLSGSGVEYLDKPEEGKIAIKAGIDGLLRINKESLFQLNMLGEVICSTLQDRTPVKKGEIVAATRLIPLVGSREMVEKAKKIALSDAPIVEVHPLKKVKIGLVITGNEVFYGRIEDRFKEVLVRKSKELGSKLHVVRRAPDDVNVISREIRHCLEQGADFIVTSGGMSVDPDDVTREGIRLAGATDIVYGTPVLPGAMFLSGMIGDVPVLGLPACGMFFNITVFDLVLPRILTGEKIGRKEFAQMGHGGLCRNCKVCTYPVCSFGK